jgi:hypothetical protein
MEATLTFVDPLPDTLMCPQCLHPLLSSQTAACGHSFCSTCVSKLMADAAPKCPFDSKPISSDTNIANGLASQQLESRLVYCPNREAGCPVVLPLFELKEHRAVCPFAPRSSSGSASAGSAAAASVPAALAAVPSSDAESQAGSSAAVQCVFAPQGCGWSGASADDLAAHLKECNYERVRDYVNRTTAEIGALKQALASRERELATLQGRFGNLDRALQATTDALEQSRTVVTAHVNHLTEQVQSKWHQSGGPEEVSALLARLESSHRVFMDTLRQMNQVVLNQARRGAAASLAAASAAKSAAVSGAEHVKAGAMAGAEQVKAGAVLTANSVMATGEVAGEVTAACANDVGSALAARLAAARTFASETAAGVAARASEGLAAATNAAAPYIVVASEVASEASYKAHEAAAEASEEAAAVRAAAAEAASAAADKVTESAVEARGAVDSAAAAAADRGHRLTDFAASVAADVRSTLEAAATFVQTQFAVPTLFGETEEQRQIRLATKASMETYIEEIRRSELELWPSSTVTLGELSATKGAPAAAAEDPAAPAAAAPAPPAAPIADSQEEMESFTIVPKP